MHIIERLASISLLSICLVSCSQTDELRSGELVAPICTGFDLRDTNNVPRGRIGIPNNKLISSNGFVTMNAYPIPATHRIDITTNGAGNKRIWIVQANVTTDVISHLNYLNAPFQVVGGAPLISWNNLLDVNASLMVNSLPKGYYRLYMQVGEEVLWENVIIE